MSIALLFALWSLPCCAGEVDFAAEPPLILALLNEAMTLELSANSPDRIRHAIMLYCKASRLGSTEAQYRFGMLYLSGRGVQKDIDLAATLFSQASQQGHYKAMGMLDTVRLQVLKLPPCLI